MIPTFQDPFLPRTTGLLGYWIRCLLGKQPLRWLHAPTPQEVRLQADSYMTTVLWQLSRTQAEIEAAYGVDFPAPELAGRYRLAGP